MKHLQSYPLYENKSRRDLYEELKHDLYETQAGKDLSAIARCTHLGSESWKTWARFKSEIDYMGDRRTVVVETTYNNGGKLHVAPGDQLMWTWGYQPASEWGPRYQHGGDFLTAEQCLRGFWLDLITRFCGEIFVDDQERQEHVTLIETYVKLLAGHAYDLADLRFLITHFKGIATGDISRMDHAAVSVLREKYPDLWQEILKRVDPEGAETSADLGELGF
jgi:hypothetical protein